MEIWLDALAPGQRAIVTGIYCEKALQRRLADFGLVEGTAVACRYRSPDGRSSALLLRNTTLAVRRSDLADISARRI